MKIFDTTTNLIPTLSDTLNVNLVKSQGYDNFFSVEFLSLVIALLAVFFGPLIHYVISKRQSKTQIKIANDNIKATVLSRNRQDWINTLRDQISEFISILSSLAVTHTHEEFDVVDKQRWYERGICLQSKISLLINPMEEDHNYLVELLDKALDSTTQKASEMDHEQIGVYIGQIVEISQKILKREWERVKSLS